MRALLALALTLTCSAPAMAYATVTVEEPKKPTFKGKQPKIYKGLRKARAVCVFVGPIVNVGANLTTAVMVIF